MPGSGPIRADATTAISGTETITRKFIVAFSAMFVVPMLVVGYLFTGQLSAVWSPLQITLFAVSAILLVTAGILAVQSVVRALVHALRDAEAVADGDISRRLPVDGTSEISQLAGHFNRVIGRLEETVESLRASRKLTHDLLSQVCAIGSRPGDMTGMFEACLNALLSLAGLQAGAIYLVASDGKTARIRLMRGLPEALDGTVVPSGHGAAGWVAARGEVAIVSEAMPWTGGELSEVEKCMSWSLHVPMTATGRTRGVISIGLLQGETQIPAEDLLTIRNLANQVAVALENAELKHKEENTYVETVAALAAAVEARDRYTRGHSRRVTQFSVEIARMMGKPDWFVKDMESAGLLHDIGKIGFPDTILSNQGPVPPEGVPLIRNHPLMGENILKPVGSLARLCAIVRHHHERFDGNGYPDRLKGEQIPLAARIIAVADSFDAMISERPYKPTRSQADAMAELIRCSGTQFDPVCVNFFLEYLRDRPRTSALLPA
ncbi:MAG: HD domain-containing phosphohydrolase [Verrucomicrobiota bacterium]